VDLIRGETPVSEAGRLGPSLREGNFFEIRTEPLGHYYDANTTLP
jgi:hypothetical protein